MRDAHLFGIARVKPYREFAAEFRWDVPATFNFGTDVVDAWAHERDGPAIIAENARGDVRTLTFSDVSRQSNRLANVLRAEGVGKGDRVVVMLPRIPEWQIALVACLKLGAIVIPSIEMLTAKDVAYRVRNAGAKAAICRAEHTAKFAEVGDIVTVRVALGGAPGWLDWNAATTDAPEESAPAVVAAEDPAVMYYTSGSTGLPKGVLHASRAIYAWRMAAIYWLDLTPDDRIWCTADTGWSKSGTSIVWGPWSTGSCAFLYDGPFVPAERLRLLAKHKISVFCAASTEFGRLVNEDAASHDLSSLRRCVTAGEALNPSVARRWETLTGVRIAEAYGQTEALMMSLNYPSEPLRCGSMGRPIPGMDLDIVDDQGRRLPDGQEGHVGVRQPCPQMMLGYWNDAERTDACFVANGEDRWYLSGDRGTRDADGYLWYAGRADDVINSAGYRIGPLEVENVLLEHDAVQECAVVGSPDPHRGEIVKAFVVLKTGFAPSDQLASDLQSHVKAITAPYKYPRAIDFVTDLPKTVTGKIRRRDLKEREIARAEQGQTRRA